MGAAATVPHDGGSELVIAHAISSAWPILNAGAQSSRSGVQLWGYQSGS
jgi:hypothetical protein